MAKRKKEEPQFVKNASGLREPFPTHPTRPTKYAVYCIYPGDAPAGQNRQIVLTFAAAYSAKKFVDYLIAGHNFKWLQASHKGDIPDTILTDHNVKIRIPGRGLEEVIEYEYTQAESEWALPEEHMRQCALLRRAPDEEVTEEGEIVAKPKREPKPEKPKIDKTALISIGDIAEQMGIEARDARQSLRKQKIEKPTGGWWFAPEKVEEMKVLIKKGLK